MDGDGYLDLVFVNRYNGTLSVLPGVGDGTFGTYLSLPYPEDYFDAEATDVVVGDINQDGKPETIPGGADRVIATGADLGGGPHVRRFGALDGGAPASGALASFFAYDPSFTGGVRVAAEDLTGDGVAETITGAGPGGAPLVNIFDGATGALCASFLAFEPGFTGGVYVAAGDVSRRRHPGHPSRA